MALATNMTTDEMNSYLNSMGVQTDITTIEKPVTTKIPIYETTETVQEMDSPFEGGPTTYKKWSETKVVGHDTVTEMMEVAQINTGDSAGTAPKINYVGNGGASRSAGGSKGGSGGGGGKGSGSSSKPKKYNPKEKDRYEKVNTAIDKIDSSLQNLTMDQDRLFGTR